MTGVMVTLAIAWGGDAPLVFLDFGERPRRAEILRVQPADAPSWPGQRAKGAGTVLVEDALRPVLFRRRGHVGVDLDGDGTIRPDETTRGSRKGETWTAVVAGGGYRLHLAWTDTRLTQQEQRHQATLLLAGTPVSVLALRESIFYGFTMGQSHIKARCHQPPGGWSCQCFSAGVF